MALFIELEPSELALISAVLRIRIRTLDTLLSQTEEQQEELQKLIDKLKPIV